MQIFVLYAVFIAACTWHAHVSSLTYWQRSRLWWRPELSSVSYGAHHWRLLTFRNPWKLYSSDVQKEMS